MINLENCKRIPGFDKYVLTNNNIVINKETGNQINPSIGNAGYLTYTLISNSGERTSVGMHRLLCMVYKPIDHPELYQVDHINGDKFDNSINNLEWCDPKENTLRAGKLGFSTKCIPVEIRNVKTEERQQFRSFTECGMYFGLSKDAISDRVLSYPKIYPGYWQFRKISSDEWITPDVDLNQIPSVYIPQHYNSEKKAEKIRKKILAMARLENNKIYEFQSMSDLAKFLNVKNGTLSRWLKSSDQPIVTGFYQLKFDDGSVWKNIDPYLGIAITTGQQPVISICDETGETRMYKSIADLARSECISANAAYSKATSEGTKSYGGVRYWIYSHYVNMNNCPLVQ